LKPILSHYYSRDKSAACPPRRSQAIVIIGKLGTVPALIQFLQEEVIQAMDLSRRVALTGQTVLVVGSLYEVETFPNGFFKWWELETNSGMFKKIY
jgi:hypothetical protein